MSGDKTTLTNRMILYVTLAGLLAIGLWLRLRFIHTVYLYPDEFATLFAVQMIGQKGLPVMPSGLFYEHGLLFSYAGSLAAWFGPPMLAVRYTSLLFGIATLALTYFVGQRWFSPAVGLIATAGLALAPTAIHWSGRARMYALLQLLVLLTLWLAYEGLVRNRVSFRWAALLAYLGAVFSHFGAITLAPPLALAAVLSFWQRRGASRLRSRQAGDAKRGSRGAREQGGKQGSPSTTFRTGRGAGVSSPPHPRTPAPLLSMWSEALTFLAIIAAGFLLKRLGQPKGIDPLEAGQSLSGIAQVFTIYSDFSFNLVAGWQAINPFFLNMPALVFTPFAVAALLPVWLLPAREQGSKGAGENSPLPPRPPAPPRFWCPDIFLAFILLTTTLEMTLFVSPDRRDDKYLFMLLPVLLLLGAQGMRVIGNWLLVIGKKWLLITGHWSSRFTFHVSRFTFLLPITLLFLLTKPHLDALLANTGDDYATAFAYVQSHWQEGDAVLTGTPTAAALYLGRNDFYSVQRRGGYDYRILGSESEATDRWLGSPAIRTEAALHQTLAGQRVWLVLERWGLQREYYDLPFQQQLLAQTEPVPEAAAQGIFVLRSKTDPQPLRLDPAHPLEATFGEQVRLWGYTVEPEQGSPGRPLRLTLYWQALQPLPHDYTIFVHLRQPGGGTVAQADHRPLGDIYPTTLWPPGETIRETSELDLPPDLPPGDYELWTGLYLLETGQRLPLHNDSSGENAVRLGVLKVSQ